MNQPPAFSRQWQELIEKASVAESRRRLGEGLADEMYDNPTVVRVSVAAVLRLRHLCPTACPLHAAPSPCQNASRRLSRVCAFRGMLNIWSNAILRSSKQVLRQHPWIFERKQRLAPEEDLKSPCGHVSTIPSSDKHLVRFLTIPKLTSLLILKTSTNTASILFFLSLPRFLSLKET